MKIDNTKIFLHLKKNFDYRKSYNLRELLHSSIKQLYFKNQDSPEIYDIVNSRIRIFKNKINQEIQDYNNYKSYLRFYWSEDDPEKLVGSAFIFPSDSETKIIYKKTLGNAFLIEKILLDLEPNLFEELCRKVLEELGCQFTVKTRHSGDAGIDFFGTLRIIEVEDNPLLKKFNIMPNAKLHFIGQAKRYTEFNVLRPSDLREFLGSALLLEFTQAWNIEKYLSIKNIPPKSLRPKDPTIWIFFSTCFATKNTKELANYLGIHLQDGEDISRWLAFNIFSDIEQDEYKIAFKLNKWLNQRKEHRLNPFK